MLEPFSGAAGRGVFAMGAAERNEAGHNSIFISGEEVIRE